jgi:hypothetical protein
MSVGLADDAVVQSFSPPVVAAVDTIRKRLYASLYCGQQRDNRDAVSASLAATRSSDDGKIAVFDVQELLDATRRMKAGMRERTLSFPRLLEFVLLVSSFSLHLSLMLMLHSLSLLSPAVACTLLLLPCRVQYWQTAKVVASTWSDCVFDCSL